MKYRLAVLAGALAALAARSGGTPVLESAPVPSPSPNAAPIGRLSRQRRADDRSPRTPIRHAGRAPHVRLVVRLSRARLVTATLAIALPFALALPLVASAAAPFDAAMMAEMTRMNGAMAAAPMTGDADADFIAMMLPHHRGAIDMATSELAYGRDPRLRRLAQEIVVTQESETQAMRAIARDLLTSKRK